MGIADGQCGGIPSSVGLAIGLLLLLGTVPAAAYEPQIHQQLTFLAAKQFNRCVADTAVAPISALQVRYAAKANTKQADTNFFVRIFRWNYYDRSGVGNRDLMWVVDTRFHPHFDELVERIDRAKDPAARYRDLGRLLGYVQDVTSPAHAVPVYTARFWRFAVTDRFDSYELDQDALAEAIEGRCDDVLAPVANFPGVLEAAAVDTLKAVQAPMFGMPVSWEVFWRLSENPGNFGDYGPAGNNFGRSAGFRCGEKQRCVLLNDDPLYADFALQRHLAAVIGSMRAMRLLQDENPIADAR